MSGKMASMSLTAQVKDELARLHVERPCCRRAELSATFRFAGGLQIVSPQVIDHRIVVEAELDSGIAARRVRKYIMRSEEHTSELQSRGHLVCRLLLEKKKESKQEVQK